MCHVAAGMISWPLILLSFRNTKLVGPKQRHINSDFGAFFIVQILKRQ
jgi:hypothetical protein